MCWRERRKKLGLLSLVETAQELFQSLPQAVWGDSNEDDGIKLLLVIPGNKSRGSDPKLWLQRFRLILGKK